MLKKVFFVVITLVFHLSGISQSVLDSLVEQAKIYSYTDEALMFKIGKHAIEIAKQKGDKLSQGRVKFHYANHYYFLSKYQTADSIYDEVIQIAKDEKNSELELSSKIRKGSIITESGDYEKSRPLFFTYVRIAEDKKDTGNWIDGLNALARIKIMEYKKDSAIYFYQKAIRLADYSKDFYRYAYLLNNIGLVLWKNKQMDEALDYFRRGYAIALQDKQGRLKGHLSNNIALIFLDKEEYDSAEVYFRKFIAGARKVNSLRELGLSLLNYSNVKYAQKQYDSTLYFALMAKDYLIQLNGIPYLPKTYEALSRVNQDIGNYNKALLYADSSLVISEDHNMLEDMMLGHQQRSLSLESLGKLKEAFSEYKLYKELNDSITDLSKDKVITEMQVKYDVEKKDNDFAIEKSKVELLEKEKEIEKSRFRFLIGFIGLIVMLFIILLILWQSRHKRMLHEKFSQQLIENIEKERGRIARDLHDDIGQTLSMIKNKIHLNSNQLPASKEIDESLGSVIEQTRQISRSLYPSYLRRVGLKEALIGLLKQMQQSSNLECSFQIDDIDKLIKPESKMHIYRICQECLNNTVKHSKANAVKISFLNNVTSYELKYQDNGIGFTNKAQLKGMGMMSIAERVKILKGEMNVSSNLQKGVKLVFLFSDL